MTANPRVLETLATLRAQQPGLVPLERVETCVHTLCTAAETSAKRQWVIDDMQLAPFGDGLALSWPATTTLHLALYRREIRWLHNMDMPHSRTKHWNGCQRSEEDLAFIERHLATWFESELSHARTVSAARGENVC